MTTTMRLPSTSELTRAADDLAAWQHDDAPLRLHPGDLGWHSMNGLEATARAARLWMQDGELRALGLLDGPDVLRLAFAPGAAEDEDIAARILADVADPDRGVLDAGPASIEARGADTLTALLLEDGWRPADPWVPFRRSLRAPVEESGIRVRLLGPDAAGAVEAWVGVHRSAFRDQAPDPGETARLVDRWRTMAVGPLAIEARSLLGIDAQGQAVAVATVWPAGPGRPGLLEPVGVHREHRGHGHGRAITLAATAVLRELGASSAIVCTEASREAAVATYASAGFTRDDDVPDLRRD